MSDETIENHHHTMTHELWIDGHHLIEKKQKNLIHTDGNDKNLVLVHIRSINEKSYKVTEIKKGDDAPPEIQVETDMAEDEVKKFEEDGPAFGIQISPKMISRNFINRKWRTNRKFEESRICNT